jgi:hypothetical protein
MMNETIVDLASLEIGVNQFVALMRPPWVCIIRLTLLRPSPMLLLLEIKKAVGTTRQAWSENREIDKFQRY